jgi:carbon-monoxide dehydrogenase medium subunit
MSLWQAYHTPSTLDEALTLLHDYGDRAKIVAGGTDLILDMESGHEQPVEALIDVTAIAGFGVIQPDAQGRIVLGAGVTHDQIEHSPLIQTGGHCLTESCGVVGGPQVRNVATIGGNVAHALPAADGTIGLLALGAEVQICTWSAGGMTCVWQPLLAIFAGPGRNNLSHDQLLSAFRFHPTREREGSAFARIMRPQGVALPVLGLAARLHVDESRRRIAQATIAIGPAGPIPFRATDAEEALVSAAIFDEAAITAAVAAAQAQAKLRTSKHRASAEYRHEMIDVLLRRVLPAAFQRAGGHSA